MEVEGRSSSPKRGYISSTAALLTSTTGCGSAESDCWAVADTATAQQSAPARPSASRFALGRYCSPGMQAPPPIQGTRYEEHTSEIQSPMRISYAVFCLKKKTDIIHSNH